MRCTKCQEQGAGVLVHFDFDWHNDQEGPFDFYHITLMILSTNDTVSTILGIMKAFLLHQNLCLSARRLCFKCKFSSITLKLVVVPSHIHESPNNDKASYLQHMTISTVYNMKWNNEHIWSVSAVCESSLPHDWIIFRSDNNHSENYWTRFYGTTFLKKGWGKICADAEFH